MRWELYLLLITGFLVTNTYYDNKLTNYFKINKKYFKMAMYGFIGLTIYVFLKKNPKESRSLLVHANDLIKYLPIDKNTTDFISPLIDFTSKNQDWGEYDYDRAMEGSSSLSRIQSSSMERNNMYYPQYLASTSTRVPPSTHASTTTKRSVSETKKKYVASRQSWKCAHCNQQLDYTYEVDHVIDLQYGGSNDIDNLVALCRNCHGKKTMKSRL